jgi:hypothetical protein
MPFKTLPVLGSHRGCVSKLSNGMRDLSEQMSNKRERRRGIFSYYHQQIERQSLNGGIGNRRFHSDKSWTSRNPIGFSTFKLFPFGSNCRELGVAKPSWCGFQQKLTIFPCVYCPKQLDTSLYLLMT